jgi:signal transduction histidine kinase
VASWPAAGRARIARLHLDAMASAAHQVRPSARVGELTRMVREADPRAIDVLIALVLTVAGLAIVIGRLGQASPFRPDDVLGAVLVLGQTLPLAVRRAWPMGVLVVISLAVGTHSALGYQIVQGGTFSSLIALYGAASLTDNRRGLLAAVISATAVAAFFATNRAAWGIPNVASTAATWAVAWLAGTFVRIRGEQADAAGARAASLEREQEARAREAVADERARIARELHDIVGHSLNIVVIQAAGARRVLDARPDLARDALASIESTGREALAEMERMLGVLRAADINDGAPGPQPGLGQIDSLAAHASEAGIPVQVVVEGDRQDVPASVDLSAYRIVQESLTNCLKHSGASRATVTVRYRAEDLEVEVVDDGSGSSGKRAHVGSGGRGHLGMRERVALFGGEISMGPAPSMGGYAVRARLPFKSTPG